MARRLTDIQKRINKLTGTDVRRSTSVRGRMSADGYYAGGPAQTLGNGRGGKFVSRRKRYYDVRKGLGMSGG